MRNASQGLLRFALVAAALGTTSWSIAYFARGDQSARLNDIANRIMAGDSYRDSALASLEPVLESANKRLLCSAYEARAVAIIRLRQYDQAISAADLGLVDKRLGSLRKATDQALSCVPTDGFLWFIRYWTELRRGGPASEHFAELRLSYQLSPFEGWVALRRSPYVLAIYETLPPDLQKRARREFAAMVGSALVEEAARILEGPGWLARKDLLAVLSDVQLNLRIQLDKRLRRDGFDVEIPGVAPTEFRPWQ